MFYPLKGRMHQIQSTRSKTGGGWSGQPSILGRVPILSVLARVGYFWHCKICLLRTVRCFSTLSSWYCTYCIFMIFCSSQNHTKMQIFSSTYLCSMYIHTVQILVRTKDITAFCADASVDVDMKYLLYFHERVWTKYSFSIHSVQIEAISR